MKRLASLVWLVTIMLASACTSTPTATDAPATSQPDITATSQPDITATPSPVPATLAPTNSPEPTLSPTPAPPTATAVPVVDTTGNLVDTTPRQPFADGPILLDSRIDMRRVAGVPLNSIRLVYDATTSSLLLLTIGDGLYRVNPNDGTMSMIARGNDMLGAATPSGLAVAKDGTVFVVGNQNDGPNTKATVRRGRPNGTSYTWDTVISTAPYPRSDTPFDHLFNGIVVSPDQKWLFVSSGSRTDHGEVEDQNGTFPDTREVALTARMYRFAIDNSNVVLQNDETAIAPYVYARGFRNAYDPAFAPNGALFVGDNGPDADFPDELNWVQQDGHYGFPWRFGDQDTPQRASDYDPNADKLLQPDFTAVQIGAYRNDPTYPPAPATMRDPIANSGPAATFYRDASGQVRNASQEGSTLASFTPHRSPLGLVFADDAFPASWRNTGTISGFILSWGAAGGSLPDRGQDMLALSLQQSGDNYTMTARQIVRNLRNPIDAAIVADTIYVLEFGQDVSIWELRFR
jgi:glucose/arabinose dehydrogenase